MGREVLGWRCSAACEQQGWTLPPGHQLCLKSWECVEAVLSLSKVWREGAVCVSCVDSQTSPEHSLLELRALWVLLTALTPAILLSVAHHSFPSTRSAF